MNNDNKTYGLNSDGRYVEMKGNTGTLTVENGVFTNTQLYNVDGIVVPCTCSYDISKSTYTYNFRNITESFTECVPSTVIGEVHTTLYNFVIWYRGTFSV